MPNFLGNIQNNRAIGEGLCRYQRSQLPVQKYGRDGKGYHLNCLIWIRWQLQLTFLGVVAILATNAFRNKQLNKVQKKSTTVPSLRRPLLIKLSPQYQLFLKENPQYHAFFRKLIRFLKTPMETMPSPYQVQFTLYHHPDGDLLPRVDFIYLKRPDLSVVNLIQPFNSEFRDFLADTSKIYEEYQNYRQMHRRTWIIFREEE